MPYISTNTYHCTSSTTSTIFQNWVIDLPTTSTASTTTTIWTVWTSHSTTTSTASTVGRPVSAQEQAEMLRLRADIEAQAAATTRTRRRANRRALVTLLRFIRPDQRDEFRRLGHFHVCGGATGRRYRINRGRVANIDVLDAAGHIDHRLCAHPDMNVPDCDTMLAQALYLQAPDEEEKFVRTANIHPRPTRPRYTEAV